MSRRGIFSGFTERTVGDYRIVDDIAEGGMSHIYKAEDRSRNITVALKLLKEEAVRNVNRHQTDEGVFSEGAIAIQLDHPNIVHTYEYGRNEGQYFIAMELIDSFSLKYLIYASSPLVREHKYDLMYQIGDGIRYMHRAGFIHRDVCPRNVLVDTTGTPKIIDFGLAVPRGRTEGRRDLRSGTPTYMAPEQVRGTNIDERCDIYAFGILAYEMLAGRLPYADEGVSVRSQHLSGYATPLRRLDPTIPKEIERLVMKAIEKEPDNRYQSMNDLLKDLVRTVPDQIMDADERRQRRKQRLMEGRRFRRLEEECFVRFKVAGSWFSPLSYRTLTKDISVNGACCIYLKRQFPVGTRLNVHLQPRGQERAIPIVAEVAWVHEGEQSKGYELGLNFVHVSDEDRERIRQYILSRPK